MKKARKVKKVRKTNKNKKLYIEIGILIIIVIVAVVITAFYSNGISFEQVDNLWDNTQDQQSSLPQEDTSLSCDKASVEIRDLTIIGQTAKMLTRNNGDSNNLEVTSAIYYDKSGNVIKTKTVLEKDFDKGEIKFFSFDDPKISCQTFSSAVLTTNCVEAKATFSGTPSGC